MDERQARDLISVIQKMVETRDDLRALAVCGSWARGNPRPDSDLDLLVIARDAAECRDNQSFVERLPYQQAQLTYRSHSTKTYGVVWSAHIHLEPDAELELTFASTDWASVDPVDPGTRKVVSDAFRIVLDKDGRLARLAEVCGGSL